jgi:hypothetical protein
MTSQVMLIFSFSVEKQSLFFRSTVNSEFIGVLDPGSGRKRRSDSPLGGVSSDFSEQKR